MPNQAEKGIYEFPPFRLDTVKRYLLRDGANVTLTPKAFELLRVLVENRDRVMTKDELLTAVWPDAIVEEANLAQNVSLARKALGEPAGTHLYIVTVPGRGYRFVAEVREAAQHSTALPPETVATKVKPAGTDEVARPEFWRRPVLWAVLGLALVSLAVLAWSKRGAESGPARPFKSLAVMPLRNLSGNPAQDYFSDGLTDSLITAFSKIGGLTVISRGSVFRFKGRDTDPREVGQSLGVEAVLEGSVRQSVDAVRVTVRLVSAQDGRVLWTGETFDRAMSETSALQDDIARHLAENLHLELSASEQERLQQRRAGSPQAYLLYLQGRHFWNKRTGENLLKAIGFFKQALDADPNYAPAYAGLADCYQLLPEYAGGPPREYFPKAKAAAQKALALDDTLAEAHAALGYTLAFYEWDWAGAERGFKRALELNPNYATAHQWYGEYLNIFNRFPESLQEFERARQLDPLSLIVQAEFPGHFYAVRQFDRAIAESKKIIAEDPEFVYGYGLVWLAYAQQGQEAETAATFTKFAELLGDKSGADELRAVDAAQGYAALWRQWLEQLDKPPRSEVATAWMRVLAYSRLNERDKMFEWLEKSYQRHDRFIVNIGSDPQFDAVRADPRFQDLLRRLGLA